MPDKPAPKPESPFAAAMMKALAAEKADPAALDAALFERSRSYAGDAPAKPAAK